MADLTKIFREKADGSVFSRFTSSCAASCRNELKRPMIYQSSAIAAMSEYIEYSKL
jgi:hypothetical protein